MIADLKPYAEYKDSGLMWLGKVPTHWDLRPAFGAFVPNHERNLGMKEKTVLSLSYGRIVIKPAEKLHGLVPESFETYQIVNPGDIVLRTTDLQNDHTSLRVGMVNDRGIITSAYLALRSVRGVIPKFAFQLLNVWDTSKAIYGYGSGLRQGLDFSHFKRMPVAVPPSDEQEAIVRFLDRANGRLDRAIRAKRKVIALLNEQKQAIIHRAVTRGLDPSVPLKPSGIPWLGDIPSHWQIGKVKRFFRTCSGATPSSGEVSLYYDGKIPWIRTMDLNNGVVDQYAVGITQQAIEDTACKVLPIGTVLIAMYGGAGTIGKNGLLAIEASTNQALCALLPSPRFEPKFVLYFMQFQRQYWMIGADGTRKDPNISQDRVRDCVLVLPPLSEQHQIVAFIDQNTMGLQVGISRREREIDLLREYRTRLVADVVTGKLDVREAAAKLPAEEQTDGAEEEIADEAGERMEDEMTELVG